MRYSSALLLLFTVISGCSKNESSLNLPEKKIDLIVINCHSKENLLDYSTTFTIANNKVDIMDHPLISDQAYSDLSATLTDAKITINYRIDFKVINTGYHLVKMTIDRYTGDYDQQYASFWYKGSVDNITEKENSVFSGICETQHDKKF